MKKEILGANPYMPLWEHVPDGEPRVFKYNGEERVYVYGSHDTIIDEYCGLDFVIDPDYDHIDSTYCFFEASSIRKVGDKYVFIYSQRINKEDVENVYPAHSNSYLTYAYSDNPLTGWKYGGKISCNGGEICTAPNGEKMRDYIHCNNHGSIVDVNGQWYIFYHRQAGTNQFARQAMLEPIDAVIDKNGDVHIGLVTYSCMRRLSASRRCISLLCLRTRMRMYVYLTHSLLTDKYVR